MNDKYDELLDGIISKVVLVLKRGGEMSNLIEFFRMVLSYLMVFAVIVAVSGIGGYIGVKVWKPKEKE